MTKPEKVMELFKSMRLKQQLEKSVEERLKPKGISVEDLNIDEMLERLAEGLQDFYTDKELDIQLAILRDPELRAILMGKVDRFNKRAADAVTELLRERLKKLLPDEETLKN